MSSDDPIETAVVPVRLREREQWVCWRAEERDGKLTKVPVTPGEGVFASSTDPETWGSFEAAFEYVEMGGADGVGFVFTDDGPVVGVDLDDCRDPETGDVDSVAQDIIERLDSYTEVSPSGTGYHVLVRGELPDGRNRRGSIELYDTARFFTVTGDHVAGTPTHVARRQDALVAIHREYVQDDLGSEETGDSEGRGAPDEQSVPTGAGGAGVSLEDEDLLERAMKASNGQKFERLWNGNTVGYDSQSEADMALCYLLAFWTGGDHMRVDRLFRQSGLLREKWDEVHYADGSTYGEKTVERAIANTSEFYDPDPEDESTHSHANSDTTTDVGRDDSDRSRAYLAEKNRLLSERVADLEATLEEKNGQIEELEADTQALRERLDACETQLDHQPEVETGTDTASENNSIWSRAKRFIGDENK